jgi:hypothetical protein
MMFGGIDPGQNGGLALLRCANNGEVISYGSWNFRNRTDRDIFSILKHDAVPVTDQESVFFLVEKQGVRPKTDRPKNIATLHDQAGMLRGFLVALKIPFEYVQPGIWQRHYGLIFPAKTKPTVKKNKHKQRAQELYPLKPVTLATCDALLIAEYARRQHIRRPHGPTD